ncbi:Appr-1-p processing protein [candidate division TA06 bacterium B3_TA06]|uniref:Appr-1-p processing protein n=1 Tax=candidate division TA06 bacterium B3_TA06 TaxID=2012487 RepID=A0A532V645_UNCT6|nr:MAG: Appr-1-p processing protein [candidate division TA06 bacterium B3_TA06]
MENRGVRGLYYIAHINNLPSILKRGILSHDQVEAQDIQFTPIYDAQIVSSRRHRLAPNGKSLWSFANLYFQPRNPMLYRVLNTKSPENIIVLSVRPDILNRKDTFVSTGNAAHSLSEILPPSEFARIIPQIRENINIEWWKEEDGSKRTIMAECLVPDEIAPDMIQTIYVASHEAKERNKEILQQTDLPIVPSPKMFFQSPIRAILTPYLSLVEGDMFFSKKQTLTVSVNCVGVMGKGLASRAKCQFPDVYVYYQDLCRKGELRIGRPHLYKRESSYYDLLAEEPSTLTPSNGETWFLLFPTKKHWRKHSDIHTIEKGLQWLRDNYRNQGIRSLALPALGCGLGRLEWRDVGPLLCKYLSTSEIPVWIYLPAEKKISDELLSKEFLLGQSQLFK